MSPPESPPSSRMPLQLGRRAWIIAGTYAVFATLWIYFSDHFLHALAPDLGLMMEVSVYKGLAFVLVTSALLLVMMRSAFRVIEDGYRKHKEHEVEIERLKRLYAALSQVNQAIVWTPARDALFQKICRVLVEEGGFRMAWIGWHVAETDMIKPVAEWGDENGYLQNLKIYTDTSPEGRGPSGTAFREARPYICNDMLNDPATEPWRVEARRRGLRASAVFPIRREGAVCGLLNVYATEAGFFQDKEISLLEEAAMNISFALDNHEREAARVKAEHRVTRERDFSEALLNSLPGVLYLYDEEGKFLRWNRTFELTSGFSAEELANKHPLDFFAGAHKERVAARIREVFTQGSSHVEADFVAKDGRSTPYFFTGNRAQIDGHTCLVGVGIDISERRRAEEERRASEARYRTLFEYAPDGILIADAESTYQDANASICQMLGYEREELIGLNATDIVLAEESPHIGAALSAIKSKSDYHREWQFRRKDGTVFPAEVIAAMMPDGNLLGLVRDISERRQAELALRELNETLELRVASRTEELESAMIRAESADRLKSAFLATMSHELRTPLNSIIGFTSILLQGLAGPLNAEQSKQLGMVRGSARHLLELINDVLDISKIEAGQLDIQSEPFDLPSTISRATALMQPMVIKKGLTLVSVISPELGQMQGDQRRVEQILINLLNNAVKFTDHGGVTLEADTTSMPPAVRLRITDTGMGIKPEDVGSLFLPFRQIDTGLTRLHEGTGLGLAICRRLAVLMSGEITVRSEWGRGSTFTVVLPLEAPMKP